MMRRSSHRRRGVGDLDAGYLSWINSMDVSNEAALLSAQSPGAAAGAVGLPTSWLTTPIASLGGIPGWAALAIGGGLFLLVAGMAGGRRR
jgi:hypothetical protein